MAKSEVNNKPAVFKKPEPEWGDLVQDVSGNIFIVTDEDQVVVIHSVTKPFGSLFYNEQIDFELSPAGLSVTLTQD